MATRIAEYIAQKLLVSSVIEREELNLYIYGFFLIITRAYFLFVTVIVGFLVDIPYESIIFFTVFMLLRTYAGGIHAKSETTCTILTTTVLIVSVFGIKIMELINGEYIAVLMLIMGNTSILLFCPLDTSNKPLENHEKKGYQIICYILVLLCTLISIVSQILSLGIIYYPVTNGICLEGILLCFGKFAVSKNKGQ